MKNKKTDMKNRFADTGKSYAGYFLRFVFCLVLTAAASLAQAQNRNQVSGKVTDKAGEPLIGATVVVVGTTTGATTGADGRFTIGVPAGGELKISYIGYVEQTVKVSAQSVLDIVLEEDSQMLKDVVVIGYGTMEKKSVTSSISSIKGDDLVAGMGGSTIATALQGKIPGLTISGSASPNSSNDFQLRGAGYSRWAGWGDHRHPIQFSGDAQANWEMLAFEVKLTAASGNAGCYYWAHDIGGFRGDPNPELTVRWTQFGALSAALRVHSTKDARLDRRPWISGERETAAMRRMYHMRSELMPYVYSSVWQTHSTMVPLNRPMYIEYGGDERAYCNEQEFLFGDLLLAAPIASPGTGPDKVASQRVWFPGEDVWYDFFTHERFDGGRECEISKPLEEFPLYVRGGWVLPMQPYTPRPASTPLTTLVMRVYPSAGDADNTYTLYEDDGVTRDYEQGAYATTQLNYRRTGRVTTVTVRPTAGSYEGQVVKRAYRLQLPAAGKIERAKVGGRSVKPVFDEKLKCHVIEVPAADIRREVKIEIIG